MQNYHLSPSKMKRWRRRTQNEIQISRHPKKSCERQIDFPSQNGAKVRNYLSDKGFISRNTSLIKSTPEGARDFVVPSRMNQRSFYADFSISTNFHFIIDGWWNGQIFQIVKCFVTKICITDKSAEFTQIDCEMAFVEQRRCSRNFEGMTAHLLKILLEKFGKFKNDFR